MTTPMLDNRYRIIRELPEGGFGRTFLAENTRMPSRKRCIIKMLKPLHNNPQIYQLVQERFHREAAILEELGENNNQIPRLYDKFEEAGLFYLVQEWIQGQTLGNIQAQVGIASESTVKDILLSILPVLQYVHSKGIIHRDIKPDNIILRLADNLPVLIDFGAVKETMGTVMSNSGNVTSSIVIGTPGFMPSEQAAGRPLFASDLYSLALTAIYLLTGKIPQELETNPLTGEILWQKHAYNVSPSFAAILDKAIHFSPRERYINAPAMLSALQAISPDPSMSPQPPPGGSYSPSPTTPSNPSHQPVMLGGGGTFNTSVPVPPEILGWNWGAFLMSGLWIFTNQVWIGLLMFVPYVNIVMLILLGAKGNVWAWRSRQWRSVQDFKSHQRAWAKAGLIVSGSATALFVLLIIIAWLAGDPPPPPPPTPSPTSSSTPEDPATRQLGRPSTPEPVTGNFFQTVEIGQLETYTYDNGLFSINVPQNWTLENQSKSGEAIIRWSDSTENGGIIIDVFGQEAFRQQNQISQDVLSSFLVRAVKGQYQSQSNLQIDQTKPVNDGWLQISWSYTVANDKGEKGRVVSFGFVRQDKDKISYIHYAVPEEQYSRLDSQIGEITTSYRINPTAPLP